MIIKSNHLCLDSNTVQSKLIMKRTLKYTKSNIYRNIISTDDVVSTATKRMFLISLNLQYSLVSSCDPPVKHHIFFHWCFIRTILTDSYSYNVYSVVNSEIIRINLIIYFNRKCRDRVRIYIDKDNCMLYSCINIRINIFLIVRPEPTSSTFR